MRLLCNLTFFFLHLSLLVSSFECILSALQCILNLVCMYKLAVQNLNRSEGNL